MKVIFDFQDMSGGAPNSQLAHMMLLHEKGHEVIAAIGKDYEKLFEKAINIKIYKIKNFNLKNPLSSFMSILEWLKILKNQQPDIIHSNRPTQNRMLAVVSKISGIPLVVAQAGGKVKYAEILPLLDFVAIVYSKENLAAFIEAGFKFNDVFLISNRIPTWNIKDQEIQSSRGGNTTITLTGNIKSSTINGIRFFIDLINNSITEIFGSVKFILAGKDISNNNIFEKELKHIIDNTNKNMPKGSKIEFLGWTDKIEKIQIESDICIGKGRSILQPAMMGKICYVISENGTLTRIRKSNFDKLYYFNFSGRGDQEDDTNEFLSILKGRELIPSLQNESYEIQEIINNSYNISYAYEKLILAYKKAKEKESNNKTQHWISGLSILIKIYYLKFRYRNLSVKSEFA